MQGRTSTTEQPSYTQQLQLTTLDVSTQVCNHRTRTVLEGKQSQNARMQICEHLK